MNKIQAIVCATALATAGGFAAGNEKPSISPLMRVQVASAQQSAHTAISKSRASSDEAEETFIPAIIRIDETLGEAAIPPYVTLLSRRGDLAIVNVPKEHINEIMSAPGIIRMESGICAVPAMDEARAFCGLNEVQTGMPDLPRSFDGTGVVCGFTDIGFDPEHVNFLNQSTGESRVKLLVNYDRYIAEPETASSEAEFKSWVTDNSENWHATHVAGILAGSYNGHEAPYMGVAPGAEIVGTTSSLEAPYLLAGCDRVVDYARSQGKPAVINMSISSFTGPRDGTTLFNEYMSRIAEDAVVCISAGNDGNRSTGCFRFIPDDNRPAVEARAIGSNWDCIEVSGVADFWSRDSKTFTVEPIVWDDLEHRIAVTLPGLDPLKEVTHVVYSSDSIPELSALDKFNGLIVMSCETNPENGRFNTAMAIQYTNNDGEHYSGAYDASKSRYHVGFRVSSAENAAVDCHVSSSLMMMSCSDVTTPAFTNSLTINDLCCGEGVISVGAFCTRTTVPVIGVDNLRIVTSDEPGAPAGFTSFGNTPAESLPHISAPGAPIISSVSEPHILASEARESEYSAVVKSEHRHHHWGEASGTSMSSPYAAGVFALWLQADPTLTPAELKSIACETALTPAIDPANPRWGAGMIDALAGLRHILASSSLAEVVTAPSSIEFRTDGTTMFCTSLRTPLTAVEAYAPDGRILGRTVPGNDPFEASLTLSVTPGSVVIATAVTADGERHSTRLLMR